MPEKQDKLEQLIMKFSYWNNRGKSAICRYLLEQLNINEKEFLGYLHSWTKRKLIEQNGNFEVIIN